MPPKSKTKTPVQKRKGEKKSVPKSGGTRRTLERSIAPTSTMDPAMQTLNKELNQREKKELISSFQEQLDMKQIENEREIRKTLDKIRILRKENDRMQKRQIAEYGMTLDSYEELKASFEQTKANNDKLHEDMVESKTLHDKLEVELKETKKRFAETLNKMNKLEKQTKVWTKTKEHFLKSEQRCSELQRNNKKLRIILLKHHIDPNVDPREFSRDNVTERYSNRSTRSYPELPKRKLTVRSRYDSIGDVQLMKRINSEDNKHGMGVHTNTFDQVSPAYLGYYMKKRQHRREHVDYIRPGVSLPRIIYGK